MDFENDSDYQLEAKLRTLEPDSPPALEALKESLIRKQKKYDKAQKTQQDIKRIALWTFVVSIVILIITLIQLFR